MVLVFGKEAMEKVSKSTSLLARPETQNGQTCRWGMQNGWYQHRMKLLADLQGLNLAQLDPCLPPAIFQVAGITLTAGAARGSTWTCHPCRRHACANKREMRWHNNSGFSASSDVSNFTRVRVSDTPHFLWVCFPSQRTSSWHKSTQLCSKPVAFSRWPPCMHEGNTEKYTPGRWKSSLIYGISPFWVLYKTWYATFHAYSKNSGNEFITLVGKLNPSQISALRPRRGGSSGTPNARRRRDNFFSLALEDVPHLAAV